MIWDDIVMAKCLALEKQTTVKMRAPEQARINYGTVMVQLKKLLAQWDQEGITEDVFRKLIGHY